MKEIVFIIALVSFVTAKAQLKIGGTLPNIAIMNEKDIEKLIFYLLKEKLF